MCPVDFVDNAMKEKITFSKFMPIVLDYVKSKGGEHAMNLLKGALF